MLESLNDYVSFIVILIIILFLLTSLIIILLKSIERNRIARAMAKRDAEIRGDE